MKEGEIKKRPQAQIRVADGAGGMAPVKDLRFDIGDWPIQLTVPADRAMDGKNLLPFLTGASKAALHDSLFWDGYEGKRAARLGRWKLVDNDGKLELFDIEADPGEKSNLAAREPDRVTQLKAAFDAWRKPLPPRIGKGGGK